MKGRNKCVAVFERACEKTKASAFVRLPFNRTPKESGDGGWKRHGALGGEPALKGAGCRAARRKYSRI